MATLSLLNVLSDISFCDKQCSNINDNTAKSNIISHIESKFSIQVIERSFVVLNPHIIKNVSYHQHLIATITAGNPYLLWFTKIDGIQCCLYIDRKLKNGYFYPKIHCVRYRFADSVFNDTMLSGELIRDNEKRWIFLINDILLLKGESMKTHNILVRFENIYKLLENEYTADSLIEPCPLQVRRLFTYKDVKQLIGEFIPSLTYPCRGIIFYTLNTKNTNYAYLFPREREIPLKSASEIDIELKATMPELFSEVSKMEVAISEEPEAEPVVSLEDSFKSVYGDSYKEELQSVPTVPSTVVSENIPEKHAIFRIFNTTVPDIYDLYWKESGELKKAGIALVPTMKASRQLQAIFSASSNILNINVEAEYNEKFDKWLVIKQVNTEPYDKKDILWKIRYVFEQ